MKELTDRQYEIADDITLYLAKHPERDYSASQLARMAKCPTHEAYPVLDHLVAENHIALTGRGGAWQRYKDRIPGRYNPGTI